MGDLKTDVEPMRGAVAASKVITDEVRAWKQRGIGALAIVGFGLSGLTFLIQHYFMSGTSPETNSVVGGPYFPTSGWLIVGILDLALGTVMFGESMAKILAWFRG